MSQQSCTPQNIACSIHQCPLNGRTSFLSPTLDLHHTTRKGELCQSCKCLRRKKRMWTGLRKQETWKMHFCQQHFSTSRKLNNYFSRKLSTHKNNIFIAFLKNAADGPLFTLEKKRKKKKTVLRGCSAFSSFNQYSQGWPLFWLGT